MNIKQNVKKINVKKLKIVLRRVHLML
jgi:hypothetical protein